MILFLRSKNNRTIVDIECFVKKEEEGKEFIELHSSIIINEYSMFLLDHLDKATEIIRDFDALSELRGWLWERYFMGGDNDPKEYNNVIKALQEILKSVAEKYDLYYVED